MIIVNLFFLKSMNGMFYYGMDYIGDQSVTLLVKKGLGIEKKKYPNVVIIELSSIIELLIFLNKSKYDVLFTPTPHPIPFFKRQFITLHDFYPFYGLVGAIKYLLFVIGNVTSKSELLLINKSAEKSLWLYLMRSRITFAPNFIEACIECNEYTNTKYKYGLIGTDSEKKNYELLLSSLPENIVEHVSLYGNNSLYAKRLVSQYGHLGLTFVDSNNVPLHSFIEMCSSIVSVSKGEGFARPIALSIMKGKPVLLINDPVFREFYDGCANFYDELDDLILDMVQKVDTLDEVRNYEYQEKFAIRTLALRSSFYEARRRIFGIH